MNNYKLIEKNLNEYGIHCTEYMFIGGGKDYYVKYEHYCNTPFKDGILDLFFLTGYTLWGLDKYSEWIRLYVVPKT